MEENIVAFFKCTTRIKYIHLFFFLILKGFFQGGGGGYQITKFQGHVD